MSDNPIRSPEQDEVGAVAFARRLVKPLVDWPSGESFVLGLYGSWGSGKTSILNLLEQELSAWEKNGHHMRAIPIRFNPWIYSDAESLLLSFFGTLNGHIGNAPVLSKDQKKALASALKSLGTFVVPFLATAASTPMLNGLGKTALNLATNRLLASGEADFQRARRDVSQILLDLSRKDMPNRIVVLIDDLDRAQAREVLAILRLIRLIADLPNISYVVAMDNERVQEVLAANNSASYGTEFLDKIIQVPVSVPPILHEKLEDLVTRSISEVVETGGYSAEGLFIDLTWRVSRYTESGIPYRDTLGRRIRTLRDRARLLNNLQFMLLSGESGLDVNPFDAVLIAFLHTFYPDVYHRVRTNKELIIEGADPLRYLLEKEDVEATRARILQRLLQGITPDSDDSEAVRSSLEVLFPRLRGTGSPMESDYLLYKNRIGHPDRFDRYFVLEPPPGEVSDEYVDEFVLALARELHADSAGVPASESVLKMISALLEEAKESFYTKLFFRVPELLRLIEEEPRVGREAVVRKFADHNALLNFDNLYKLVLTLAKATPGEALSQSRGVDPSALPVVRAAVESVPDPRWAILLAARLLSRIEGETRDKIDTSILEVATLALERFDEYQKVHPNVFKEAGARDASHLVWRWRDLLRLIDSDLSSIQSYLHHLVTHDLESLPSVIALFAGWSDGVPSLDYRSEEEIRSSADEVVGADFLLQRCRDARELDVEHQPTDPHGLIEQYIHHFVSPKLFRGEDFID